jgi:hypothetical protein
MSFVPDQSLLSFPFGTDQSFLAHTVRKLKAIVSRFQVLLRPNRRDHTTNQGDAIT